MIRHFGVIMQCLLIPGLSQVTELGICQLCVLEDLILE